MAEPAGTGAIMARKRIKAIAVRGGAPVAVADRARVDATVDAISRRVASSELAAGIRQYGSLFYAAQADEWGALTGRNGQEGRIPHIEAIGRGWLELRGSVSRAAVNIARCPAIVYVSGVAASRWPIPSWRRWPGFGGRCGVASPDAVIVANDLCLRLAWMLWPPPRRSRL